MYRNFTLLILGFTLLSGCTSRESNSDPHLPLCVIDSFEVWHNLMPGGSPALYFTSVVKLERNSDSMHDSINIEKVSLYYGETEAANFKVLCTDISGEYPDSVQSEWLIYRLVPEQGFDGFNPVSYENYTALVTLAGGFGRLSIKRTGIEIQKVY